MVWNTRTIYYTNISGSCAISPDGQTIAYGYSGGASTDAVNIIEDYGLSTETTFQISVPPIAPGVQYNGYGISLNSDGSYIASTGYSVDHSASGVLYKLNTHRGPTLTSQDVNILSDSTIIAPDLIVSNSLTVTNVFASNISAGGTFGTSGQILSQTGTGIGWASPSTLTVSVASVSSGTYQILDSDYYIGCDGSGIVLTLPPGTGVLIGKVFIIKDESGLAATNHITVNGSGDLIDGNSSLTIVVNYLALGLLWTGTKWSII